MPRLSTVRVSRPPEVTLGEFLAVVRKWLDHQCILADFQGRDRMVEAQFDNPRDARLFERRFAHQSTRKAFPREAPIPVPTPSKEMPTLGGVDDLGEAA